MKGRTIHDDVVEMHLRAAPRVHRAKPHNHLVGEIDLGKGVVQSDRGPEPSEARLVGRDAGPIRRTNTCFIEEEPPSVTFGLLRPRRWLRGRVSPVHVT